MYLILNIFEIYSFRKTIYMINKLYKLTITTVLCFLVIGFSHSFAAEKKKKQKKSKTASSQTISQPDKSVPAVSPKNAEVANPKSNGTETIKTPLNFDALQKLPLNPAVRYGKLPNGLTYYIQQNKKPENRVEFRLAVNAGSNQEEDAQKGLAHFVEHMAFNGSKHFTKNELVNYLESVGTKFGAHLNAYTSFDETVYMLQLPTDKKEILDKGLLVLEDWAGGLSFDKAEIDKERGVVVSEWRSGLGANQRMLDKYLPVVYYKSRYAERLPIGDTMILKNAPTEQLISFYKKWYRPDLMSVIIVGDINVDAMEAEVKKRFSALQNPIDEKQKITYTLPEHKDVLVSICTDPEATYSQAMVIYKHPAINTATVQGYKQYLMNSLYNGMLNLRLQELMQKPNPPFFAAYSGYDNETRANDSYTLAAIAKSGQTIDALKVILTENERVKRYGFTTDELERMKLAMVNNYENALNEKDKTESSSFVQEYVTNFLEDVPAPGIDVEAALALKVLPTITLKEINELSAKYITDKNCVVVITAPESEKKFLPWENDIKELVQKVKNENITPYLDNTTKEPLISRLPTPSPVVKETKNEKYNITTLVLKNGVRILLKPTTLKNDEILMTSYSNGGTSLYSDEDYMSADYSNAVVAASGVSNFDNIALQKMLAGKTVEVAPYVGELDEGITGTSNQKDVETLLQLTYLYFTQPRKSLDDYNSFMSKQKSSVEHILDNPNAYFANKFQNVIYNNNIRRGITTIDKLNKVDFEKAFSFYKERFNDAADFTFVFVGNFEIEKLKPLLETYLGGLPTQGKTETWKDPNINKKTGLVSANVQMGKTQKDLVGIHFHGQTPWSDEDNYIFNSMIKVLNIQLREAIREDKGGVYGVGVNGIFVERPKNAYGITIQFNTEPARVKELINAVYDNIDYLKKNGVSQEKITKVQETQRRERETDLQENSFWLNTIRYTDQYGKDISAIEKYAKQIDALNSDELKKAFNRFFDMSNHIEMVLEPEK